MIPLETYLSLEPHAKLGVVANNAEKGSKATFVYKDKNGINFPQERTINDLPGVNGYILWALSLQETRMQWSRITLMQTNREDVGQRYREIIIPKPPTKEWAEKTSLPFKQYFSSLAEFKNYLVLKQQQMSSTTSQVLVPTIIRYNQTSDKEDERKN